MHKHAPGPWKFRTDLDCRVIEDSHGTHLFEEPMACSESSGSWPIGEAMDSDFVLASCAPDLLTACEAALSDVILDDYFSSDDFRCCTMERFEEVRNLIRSAVAKAMGETK